MGAVQVVASEGGVSCAGRQGNSTTCCTVQLPESQPLLHLVQEASMELVDGIDVGEEQGHQGGRHGVLLDHHTSEPLWEEFGLVRGSAEGCGLMTPSKAPPVYKKSLNQRSTAPLY